MSRVDQYRHLNDHGDGAVIGIEQMAGCVVALNYGTHRMVSALIRQRRMAYPGDPMADALEKALNSCDPQ